MSVPPDAQAHKSPVRRIGETCLWLVLIGLVVLGVLEVASRIVVVVLGVLLALVLATLLVPVVRWLERHGWKPGLAAITVLLTALVAMGALAAWIVPTVSAQLGDLGVNLTGGLREVERWLVEGPLGLSPTQVNNAITQLEETVRNNVGGLAQGAITGATLILQILAGILLAVVVLFFLLKDGPAMWRWLLTLVPWRHRDEARDAGERSWGALSAFIRAQTFVAAFDALFIGVGLVVLGVPLALVLSVLTFFAAYIPYIGAISAGAAAVLVALVAEGPLTAAIVLGLIIVVQQVEGNILQPVIMGRALHIHPVIILVGVTAGGLLAGIVGTIVATPLIAAASGIFDHFRQEHPPLDEHGELRPDARQGAQPAVSGAAGARD